MEYTVMNNDGTKTVYSFNSVDSKYIDTYIRGFQPKCVKHYGVEGNNRVLTSNVVNGTKPAPSPAELMIRKKFHLA